MIETIAKAYDQIKTMINDLSTYGFGMEIENDLSKPMVWVADTMMTTPFGTGLLGLASNKGTWVSSPGADIKHAEVEVIDCDVSATQSWVGAAVLYQVYGNNGSWARVGIYAHVRFGDDGDDAYGLLLPPADNPTNSYFWKDWVDHGADPYRAQTNNANYVRKADTNTRFDLSNGAPYKLGFDIHVSTNRVARNQRLFKFTFVEPVSG